MKKSEALKILGLTSGASEDEIKKAHRALIIENHPDKFGQDSTKRAAAEEKTKLINEARDVLLNHSWEPEYATAGTPYGAPYSYNPYTKPGTGYGTGGQNPFGPNAGNPFEGWPFSGSFVWTTWDADGNRTTYTNQGPQSGPAGSPFGGTNPFVGFDFSDFIPREPTTAEKLQAAERALRRESNFLTTKVIVLAIALALGASATGLYLYTILSIGQGIWKRLRFLSAMVLLPFIMLAIIFTPGANSAIGIIGLILFACSVGFDVYNVHNHTKRIKALKDKLKKEQEV